MVISNDGVVFPGGTVQTTAAQGTYVIGGKGPAGGWVFYVTSDGFHGLEAAEEDTAEFSVWGCSGTDIPGAAGTAIGTGASNTDDILDSVSGCSDIGMAAGIAANYVSPSGYFDWYLPSKDELDLMYDNIGPGNATDPNVGNFAADQNYWSSSESTVTAAWTVYFGNGNPVALSKNFQYRMRAVRFF
jgi:hypothetical protein